MRKILGLIVAVGLWLNLILNASAETETHVTKDGIACASYDAFAQLFRYAEEKNLDAAQELNTKGLCLSLKPGLKVVIESEKLIGSHKVVEIRLVGTNSKVWTNIESIQ